MEGGGSSYLGLTALILLLSDREQGEAWEIFLYKY